VEGSELDLIVRGVVADVEVEQNLVFACHSTLLIIIPEM